MNLKQNPHWSFPPSITKGLDLNNVTCYFKVYLYVGKIIINQPLWIICVRQSSGHRVIFLRLKNSMSFPFMLFQTPVTFKGFVADVTERRLQVSVFDGDVAHQILLHH